MSSQVLANSTRRSVIKAPVENNEEETPLFAADIQGKAFFQANAQASESNPPQKTMECIKP
ncbi:hypothetical protein [Pseudomonas hefeiensis]|uniref:Uncharacterized protein n=1 Tax=Pseudomonas hefeiensis TaxID=2738125 RepID=A0ABY9GB42_9PSED|nr:hypothetical protein [Pseudomonas sp. FP205]WLH12875.1 hypothetical protein PSH57_00440 [Pseudomonas sp. FP205]